MKSLPMPAHYDRNAVDKIWEPDYANLAEEGPKWAKKHGIRTAATDKLRIAVMGIDIQNTFAIPGFELFVGGRSGTGAVDDTRRTVEFGYRNLGVITKYIPTMDTHTVQQIFHPDFIIDRNGNHPAPHTTISYADVKAGKWSVNPSIVDRVGGVSYQWLQSYLLEYCRILEEKGKFQLTIWPYHAMLGGIGHALVPSFHEMIMFHSFVRDTDADPETKGGNPLTENYSAIQAEVLKALGYTIAQKSTEFMKTLTNFDRLIIMGQAKSHCVAWTVADFLNEISAVDPALAKKVYLVEDCMSSVVVPNVVDFTESANKTFDGFAKAGMNIVKSTDPIENWPGMGLK